MRIVRRSAQSVETWCAPASDRAHAIGLLKQGEESSAGVGKWRGDARAGGEPSQVTLQLCSNCKHRWPSLGQAACKIDGKGRALARQQTLAMAQLSAVGAHVVNLKETKWSPYMAWCAG
jgi:hypothetical protein